MKLQQAVLTIVRQMLHDLDERPGLEKEEVHLFASMLTLAVAAEKGDIKEKIVEDMLS